MILPLAVLLASLSAAEPAAVIPGYAAGLGISRWPQTARLTYDRKLAAQGGRIFALGDDVSGDEEAVRMSQAVVLTGGGLMSRPAVWARAHGVPALVVPRARWDGGKLVVDVPVFGPEEREAGTVVRPLTGRTSRTLEEGEVVSVDAVDATLTLYPAEEQQRELDLAQALQAYAGLRDGQALILWWRGREGDAELAPRLESGLAGLVAAGEGRPEDFRAFIQAVESFLPVTAREAFHRQMVEDSSERLREAAQTLAGLRQDLDDASTAEAAGLLGERAAAVCRDLDGLASPAGLKKPAACGQLAALAGRRAGALAGKAASSWRDAAQAAGAKPRAQASVSADVYRDFMARAGLAFVVDDAASDASLSLARKAERIRALFDSARIAEGSAAAQALARALPGGGPYDFSCADGLRAGVAKAAAPAALLDCWADFWSAGPLGARLRGGVKDAAPEVIISPVITGGVSGTLYSREPGGAEDRVFVSAGGDQYLLGQDGRELMAPIVGGEKRLLSAGQLARLAKVARALDGYFGSAAQADFAWEGDSLYVLSAAPADAFSR